MRQIGSFNHYELAMSAGDAPMPLFRASCEEVYLGVDRRHRQLVEVHFVAEAAPDCQISLPPGSEQGADPVLDSGEVQGTAFYVTAFHDGELLEHYISRRGALIAPTAFSLVLHLLDELLTLEKVRGHLQGVSLERVLVCLEDDSLLRLRILDYGYTRTCEGSQPDEKARQVREVCLVLSRLLTGPLRAGIHPDRVAVLNACRDGCGTVCVPAWGSRGRCLRRWRHSAPRCRRPFWHRAAIFTARTLAGMWWRWKIWCRIPR
ncbi:hypothetical protein [Verrucomicrobium spinosum]|uniref:hypothetical protein n=1 Tax=Verrucomicrobium spinosum TaxID=2736 RepID=UPI000A9F7C69|nr:hypothetical protein [Verrucomicrobium spinosum]